MTKNNTNYSNLINNIVRERNEYQQQNFQKNYNNVEEILTQKYNLKRPPYVREGLSVTQEEVDLAKVIRGKLAQVNPLEIPSKSEIYRAGLHVLKEISAQEILDIINTLN